VQSSANCLPLNALRLTPCPDRLAAYQLFDPTQPRATLSGSTGIRAAGRLTKRQGGIGTAACLSSSGDTELFCKVIAAAPRAVRQVALAANQGLEGMVARFTAVFINRHESRLQKYLAGEEAFRPFPVLCEAASARVNIRCTLLPGRILTRRP